MTQSRTHLIVYLLICSFLYPLTSLSQNISNIRFWGSNNGLPSRMIKSIVKDKKGYVWLGTQSGLVRFDGREFVNHSVMSQSPTLANESCSSVEIEQDTILWVGTENGLFKINLNTYQSQKICLPKLKASCISDLQIKTMLKHSSGAIFIGAEKQFIWMNYKNTLTAITNPFSADSTFEDIVSFTEDSQHNIWFTSSRKQLYCYDFKKKKVVYYRLFEKDIYGVSHHKNYGIVLAGIDGIFKFDSTVCKLLTLKNVLFKNANQLLEEPTGGFWLVRNEKNLYLYEKETYTNMSRIFDLIGEPNFSIKCIYKEQNTIWVGTNFGLVKFTNTNKKITYLFGSKSTQKDLKNHSVRGICELPDKSILLATYEGIYKSAPPYSLTTSFLTEKKAKFVPYALHHENQTLWIASEGAGLIKYNLKHGTIEHKNSLPSAVRPRFLLCITNDTINNRLLLGSYAGLIIFDKKSNTFYKPKVSNNGKTDNAMVYQITWIDNSYWLCTSKGLFRCSSSLAPIKLPIYLKQFSEMPISCIEQDSTNKLIWIGSLGNGLFSINQATQKINSYTFSKGFPNDFVVSIKPQNNGLWVGTYNGLCRIVPATGTLQNLYSENGLSHNEFNHGASYLTRNGYLIMGGMNGYNIITSNVDEMVTKKNSKLFISKLFLINGKHESTLYNCANNYNLNLPTNNKVIEVEFGIDDYNQPENNIFSYMIEGLDHEWIFSGNRNYIRLTDLKPGNYKLYIKGAGTTGNWSTDILCININVDGYFYQKWWFILLVFMLILLTVVIFYRIKLNQLNKLAHLRLQISSDLHDEVGSILTAVGMQAEMLKQSNQENNQSTLNKIAETSRQAVSNMRDVIWSIDARNDKCSDLIDRMHEYINLVVDNDYITCRFEKKLDNHHKSIDLVLRQNTFLIFKEAINNIVKHAHATQIDIVFTLNNKELSLAIKSNGSGNGKHKMGMGIQNMEMRAKKMKAQLTLDRLNNYQLFLFKEFKK